MIVFRYFYNLRTQLILIWALCLRNYQQKIYMFMLRPYKELEKRWDSIPAIPSKNKASNK